MTRKSSSLRLYRRIAFCLGLFAMALQALGSTAHMGAMAASAAGNTRPLTGAFGLMQICTPQGIVTRALPADNPARDGMLQQPCPLCSVAAFSALLCNASGAAFAPAFYAPLTVAALRRTVEVKRPAIRQGLSRAPPA